MFGETRHLYGFSGHGIRRAGHGAAVCARERRRSSGRKGGEHRGPLDLNGRSLI
jgi:general stress protein YciG